MTDREQARKAYYEADYQSATANRLSVDPAARAAHALEYIAYQMGQINRKMDKLVSALEKAR